jgi:hypothetical protein
MARADPDARAAWSVAAPVELARGGPHNYRQVAIAQEVASDRFGEFKIEEPGFSCLAPSLEQAGLPEWAPRDRPQVGFIAAMLSSGRLIDQ